MQRVFEEPTLSKWAWGAALGSLLPRWALAAALLGSLVLFHTLFWDNGRMALHLFGLEWPRDVPVRAR